MTTLAPTTHEAVAEIQDGASVMFGGFGGAGFAFGLREALAEHGPRELTIICNNADFGSLAERRCIRRIVCSYPTGETAAPVFEQIERGEIELLLTPQGTLAEQIRAGAAGIGGVLTPTGVDLELGAEWREIEYLDRRWILAPALRADVALLHAAVADSFGNLVLRHAARNFTPLMAMAADRTIVEVDRLVRPGEIDPDQVHVPSAFVDVLVETKGARR